MSRSPTLRAATAVFRILGDHPDGLTPGEIRDRLSDRRLHDKVGQALARLSDGDEVEPVPAGKPGYPVRWRLSPAGLLNHEDYLARLAEQGLAAPDPIHP